MNKPDKLPLRTPDLTERNYAALVSLFPNAVTETINENGVVVRAIDADVLRQEINAHVVEGKEERYQFTWPDKKKAVLLANAPIAATLRPCREESVDFDNTENLYIEGDNLDVLKLLRETYLNRVKMIYIDPPYNTGNDFVYSDEWRVASDEWREMSGDYDESGNRMVRNLDSNGRFHTDWLNMMYPRLRVAKDLLTDDGVIFISIDDGEVAQLRKICDEIFGEQNFVSQITWKKTYGGGSKARYVVDLTEYVLLYARNLESISTFDLPPDPKTRSYYTGQDEKIETRGPFRTQPLATNSMDNRPNLRFPIKWQGQEVWPEKQWQWSKERVEKALENNELIFTKNESGKWSVRYKQYLFSDEGEERASKLFSLIEGIYTQEGTNVIKEMFDDGKTFTFPKPPNFIKHLLSCAWRDKCCIILDFFSGSATTAHAVMQLNAEDGGKRKFIMVQLPEKCDEGSEAAKAGYKNICEIGKERIRRAGTKIVGNTSPPVETGHALSLQKQQQPDIGFRVLKLDSSNMQDVYYTPQNTVSAGGSPQRNLLELVDNIKPDRTAEDLLFQVMLDLGIPLSAKIEKRVFSGQWLVASEKPVQGQTVFFVDPASTSPSPLVTNNSSLSSSPSSLATSHYLIACFDRVTDAIVTEIAKSKPYYAVFRDSGFASDATLANFEQIFKTYSPSTIRKVL